MDDGVAGKGHDDARRLPVLISEVEEIVRSVDPLELLAHLTVLHQGHRADEAPDMHEHARWQVRIEWLAGLIFSHGIEAPEMPGVIDSRVLTPLEQLLDECMAAAYLTLLRTDPALSDEQNELRKTLQLHALFVRGEGFQCHIKALSLELYSTHNARCLEKIGVTAEDAFTLAHSVFDLSAEKRNGMRAAARDVEATVQADPSLAASLDGLPPQIQQALATDSPVVQDPVSFAKSIAIAWLFGQAKHIVSFKANELKSRVPDVPSERVDAFLALISTRRTDAWLEPNPLTLSPLAKRPLFIDEDRFYLFTPSVLYSSIYYAFHGQLFGDEEYRNTYNDARTDWLESSSVESLSKLLPGALSDWGLAYNDGKGRDYDVDGIVLYDNKLILIECKWKAPRLEALSGEVDAALKDIDKALAAPFEQAQRARDYIQRKRRAEFTQKRTGRRIVVDAERVEEVFLVTVVGSLAWAHIAANLAELAPLGRFSEGEFPWAVSLIDLRVARDCFDVPCELFDYLRRRRLWERDGRLHLHDEWDYLGCYLHSVLDPMDPRFTVNGTALHRIALDGMDDELQAYYYNLGLPQPRTLKQPRRTLPQNIKELLTATSRLPDRGTSDAICAVLIFRDEELAEAGRQLDKARKMTVLDGKVYMTSVGHPWRSVGFTVVYGYGDRRSIQLGVLNESERAIRETGAKEWAAFGVDLASPDKVVVAYFPPEGRITLAGTQPE